MKKWILVIIIVILAIQFIRPKKNSSSSLSDVHILKTETVPTKVSGIMQSACFDCHSNNTIYPWYAQIAPVSWWLSSHIKDGKKHLNFSEWGNYDAKRKDHKIEELIEMVGEGAMPLKSYTYIHDESRLTKEQREELLNWFKKIRADIVLN